MTTPCYIVDAFAEQPFSGNPAAVCLLKGPHPQEWMQAVAAEFNQAETAFLHPDAESMDLWHLRWFTPVCEIELCGHATLASAHVLWREQGVTSETLRFATLSGELQAQKRGGRIELDFPSLTAEPLSKDDVSLQGWRSAYRQACNVARSLLIELPDARSVRDFDPAAEPIADIPVKGVMITAPGDDGDTDYVARFFAPRFGIPEDSVTGSAHCGLGPYWASKLGRNSLRAHQCSPRGGRLQVEVVDHRVRLIGSSITTVSGTLT